MAEAMRGRQYGQAETEMERGPRESYESTGYGQQSVETGGTQQPSLMERAEQALTGKPSQEQQYQRSREYTGTETGTGTGSLAESMRSTYSTRPALGSKYEEQKQPTMGERIKQILPGTGSTESGRGSGYYEQGRGSGYEQQQQQGTGRGYYQQGRTEQPTIMERVESTFTGRTAQEQHDYDVQQRRQREMERERSRGPSSSEQPGVMSQLGSFVHDTSTAMFGTSSKKTMKQRMNESIQEIRTSLTGRPGETSHTPMEQQYGYTGSTSQYPTQQRRGGTSY